MMVEDDDGGLESGVSRCPPTHPMRGLAPVYPEQFKSGGVVVVILRNPDYVFDGLFHYDELIVILDDWGRVMRE